MNEQWQEIVLCWGAFVAVTYIFATCEYFYYKCNVKKKLKAFKDIMTEE